MSQRHDDTRETFTSMLKSVLVRASIVAAALGTFAFTAWNSSTSGFAGVSLNAAQDLKQEEFLAAITTKLSSLHITSSVNKRNRAIKIFANDANFEANSSQLTKRQNLALGQLAQVIQAALQCTDTNNELQLAAKPLEEPVLDKTQCHRGETIAFTCDRIFRDLKVKRILVNANETSHALAVPNGPRQTHSQILNQRNDVLVNAFHSCEPELRRYSFADSKPLLRHATEQHTQTDNTDHDHERLQLRFEFD